MLLKKSRIPVPTAHLLPTDSSASKGTLFVSEQGPFQSFCMFSCQSYGRLRAAVSCGF